MAGTCRRFGVFWWRNLREKEQLGDPGVYGRIILRWIIRKCVPVLAQIESRILDFEESKCLFRGPEILMGTNNYKQLW